MKVYESSKVRNVALIGHHGSGKSMLSEAMLFNAGHIDRMGSIEAGTSASDYHPSEVERQMSIFTSLLHAEWKDHKINILDSPGYPDFLGEVIASLRVADTAVFVMNAAEGVQVGTEAGWVNAELNNTPSLFVLNHLDKPESSFETLVEQLKERFSRGVTVVQLPGGEGTRSIIDVLLMKQLTYPEGSKEAVISDIDPAFLERAQALHNELVENIAENDESLMELYFEKGELTEDEMRLGLAKSMKKRELFPIFLTSATNNIGVSRLMSFITNACPNPLEMPETAAEPDPVKIDSSGSVAALVYRTMAEHHVGEYSFFKVFSGVVKTGLDLENAQSSSTERFNQIYVINGKERENVDSINAGDLGAVVKLKNTHTNNTLREKGTPTVITGIQFPSPKYKMAVECVNQGDEDKLAQGLHTIHEEDPSLVILHDTDLNQMLLAGQGEMHLKVAAYRLKNRFHAPIDFSQPKISYRETATKRGDANYRHKKQSGGAGQFADITLYVEPIHGEYNPPKEINVRNKAELKTSWGSKVEFIDGIVGGVIDMKRFFSAIQKGIAEALQVGPIAGYPVGDIRIVIYDGGMHPVDSNDNAFRMAAKMAFRDAFKAAAATILEPIQNLKVLVPESYMGDVLGDLNTKRARIQGMEAEGIFQSVIAQVPESEMYQYSTTLRSLTQGRGIHTESFHSYEPVPRNLQDKIKAQKASQEEAS